VACSRHNNTCLSVKEVAVKEVAIKEVAFSDQSKLFKKPSKRFD